MQSKYKSARVTAEDLDALIGANSSEERVTRLTTWRNQGLTMDATLLRGLMRFPLSQNEIITGFEICHTDQKDSFELWVMNNLLTWDQNVVASAIRAWARITDRILWHRLLPIAAIPGLPQRIRYTILDVGHLSHGFEITKATLASPGWEDLSSAFHALLFERAMQFDLPSPQLTTLAWKILKQNLPSHHPEDKSLIPAIGWLCRHEEKELSKWAHQAPTMMWTEMVRSALETHGRRSADIAKLDKSLTKSANADAVIAKLPALWSRGEMKASIYTCITTSTRLDGFHADGFPQSIINVIDQDHQIHETWVDIIIGKMPYSESLRYADRSDRPFASSYNQVKFKKLHEARTLAVSGSLGIATDTVNATTDFSSDSNNADELKHPIREFFDAMEGRAKKPRDEGNAWGILANAWQDPVNADLNKVTSATRKHKGLVSLAHIMTMSRMTGRDDAVLKLLDYIRSNEEFELRAVARALGQINTSRSLLELIAMLTRPNATIALQQDIVVMLHDKNLKGLQNELRSAIHDLRLPVNTDHPIYQLKEELSGMLLPVDDTANDVAVSAGIEPSATKEGNLDQELSNMIPHYKELSSEVKRSLRTALFFNKTVVGSQHANSIDLSPLIDMQYKAMELLYREFFEDMVTQSLQRGVIQRKLDVIGYARPIVRNMDDFEAYIASLPVVKDIPFFSKFKLRKMLRAICQFEPGRRFTLDGLKAFGLYFLVFGRQQCKQGLAQICNVGTQDDLELAQFCKELHVFQDFRNRAAHEGFHPDASNDVMGIWRTTALIVQWAFKARNAQKTANTMPEKTAS